MTRLKGMTMFSQAEDGIRDVAVTGVQTCALPILQAADVDTAHAVPVGGERRECADVAGHEDADAGVAFPLGQALQGFLGRREYHLDRKSTRLNSSHGYISYAVFCLKKKTSSHRSAWARPAKPATPRDRARTSTRMPSAEPCIVPSRIEPA